VDCTGRDSDFRGLPALPCFGLSPKAVLVPFAVVTEVGVVAVGLPLDGRTDGSAALGGEAGPVLLGLRLVEAVWALLVGCVVPPVAGLDARLISAGFLCLVVGVPVVLALGVDAGRGMEEAAVVVRVRSRSWPSDSDCWRSLVPGGVVSADGVTLSVVAGVGFGVVSVVWDVARSAIVAPEPGEVGVGSMPGGVVPVGFSVEEGFGDVL
jgi:hypothetical protein